VFPLQDHWRYHQVPHRNAPSFPTSSHTSRLLATTLSCRTTTTFHYTFASHSTRGAYQLRITLPLNYLEPGYCDVMRCQPVGAGLTLSHIQEGNAGDKRI
jgi:hypothetical protein